MIKEKPESAEIVERERAKFNKISFICYAKNKLNRYREKIGFMRRIVNIAKIQNNNLSFLCAIKVMRIKDKYA